MKHIDESHYYPALATGWLCLDFANTAQWHASEKPNERLKDLRALIIWASERAIIDSDLAKSLQTLDRDHPHRAEAIYREAMGAREAIYVLISAIAAGNEPPAAATDHLNKLWAKCAPHLQISPNQRGFKWSWADHADPHRLIAPVIWSATTLLTSSQIDRVGECADDRGCGWLFFDTSRNRSRRWCDMGDCGNRDKVRRYYARKRDEASRTAS